MRAALLGCLLAATLGAEDWAARVAALRPANTSEQEKAVLDALERRAQEALAAIPHARTPHEADRARPALRRRLAASLGFGLLPWPPDLRARVAGTVARRGYRIEKIVYQTLPGTLVPAHLYLPDPPRGPAPAVLFYNGHWWVDSKSRPDFQAFCINMARLGFLVLSFDTFGQGERGVSSRDHRRVESLPVGVAQQGFAEYETRCALEYLLSRPEVDRQRVGMTGASGGGYNTWITAALDDRIRVAVPVVGTSEFLEQIHVTRALDWYHAAEHCHFVPGLIRYANNHEFLAMVAPRPLLIVAASKDQSFPIEGVRAVYGYGRDLYRAAGIPQKIGFYEDTADGHGYQVRKREAAYGWFLRWLMGRGDGSPYAEPPTETEPFDSPELRCFPPGENQPAGPGMIEAVKRLARGLPPRTPSFTLEPAPGPPLPKLGNARVERLLISDQASAFLIQPEGDVRGVLIGLDDRGKEAIARDLPVDNLLESGWALCGLDPRGLGESATSKLGWVAAVSLLLNDNFVMQQARDVLRAMEWFRGKPLALYARGQDAALAATYVAGARRDLRFAILREGFTSFRQFFERPQSLAASFRLRPDDKDRLTAFDREIPFHYVPFGALRDFDLPRLLARSGARVLAVNSLDGDWARADAPADAVRKFLAEVTRNPRSRASAGN